MQRLSRLHFKSLLTPTIWWSLLAIHNIGIRRSLSPKMKITVLCLPINLTSPLQPMKLHPKFLLNPLLNFATKRALPQKIWSSLNQTPLRTATIFTDLTIQLRRWPSKPLNSSKQKMRSLPLSSFSQPRMITFLRNSNWLQHAWKRMLRITLRC